MGISVGIYFHGKNPMEKNTNSNGKMGNLHGKFSTKMAHLQGTFTKKILFSWEIFKYGNISVALMIKKPMLLQNFFFHVLDTITQPVLGKVKIPMTISSSAVYQ
jgi:hypothetical protein